VKRSIEDGRGGTRPSCPPNDRMFLPLEDRLPRRPPISSRLGSGTHPVCKSGYGSRAARVALGAVYGRPVEISGPVYLAVVIGDSQSRPGNWANASSRVTRR
jgi:hypothetical protein